MTLAILRFFRAADPMPPWLAVLTAAVGVYAATIAVMNPDGVDEALAMLLLWQMFCAATGFARHASAGHFDTALVRWPRGWVATGHAVHSIWPVIALWLLIAGIEAVSARRAPLALEPGRLAALIFVSLTSWCASLPAARLVTGAVWLLLIVAGATTRLGTEQYAAMLARPDAGAAQLLHAAALTLACPFLLIGDHLPPRAGVASIVIVVAISAFAAGMLYVRRRDYALEATI